MKAHSLSLRACVRCGVAALGLLAAPGVQPAAARVADLLPRPQQVAVRTGEAAFALGRAVRLTDPTRCEALRRFLADTGCTPRRRAAARVEVRLVPAVPGSADYRLPGFADEAYTLAVNADEIRITAATPTGVIRAAQTLTQLAEGYPEGQPAAVEALTLTDWPAFKLRGFMHDVGRSYLPVEEIKREIDLLARFKVNVFHWHLTENQAWRFEVKAYPQLTAAAYATRHAGLYYTQAQCREVESYAAARGMTVIPEIDMPGHSAAFERAMGHAMQTDAGVAELKTILTEVAAAFPRAPYIHVGADEQRITYPGFLQQLTAHVHALGRRVVVWNPIRGVRVTPALGADMAQLWSTAGRAVEGMANIDCRYNYTNHFDLFADVAGIYLSNIYYSPRGSATVAGAISAAWTDRLVPAWQDIVRQNNLYANVLAVAERAWAGGGEAYIEQGGTLLPEGGARTAAFADWERRFLFHKAHALRHEPIAYVKQTNVHWRITEAFPNGGDADLRLPPETEGLKDSYTYQGRTYTTGTATGAAVYLRHTWGGIVPGYFADPQPNTTAYAWTYVHSPREQEAGALVEFQNYSRSENDRAPEPGRWDRKGSRLYVNDREVMPPAWENAGLAINAEVPLRNENCTARPPVPVHLRKGWNKVLLKLPYNPTDGVRLTKWMFTFVLTDKDGRDALDGIVYSSDAAPQVRPLGGVR